MTTRPGRPPEDARPQWATPPAPVLKKRPTAPKTVPKGQFRSCAGIVVGLVVFVGVLVYFLMPNHDTPTMKAAADNGQTLPEQLTFKGVITGKLTTALNAQGIKHAQADPQPNSTEGGMFLQTSCSIYKLGDEAGAPVSGTPEWEADIYGQLDGKSVTLRISTEDGTVAGKHDLDSRGGSAFPHTVQAYIDTPSSHDLYYPDPDSTVMINPDLRSGTIHLVAGDMPDNGDAKETVDGIWRCA